MGTPGTIEFELVEPGFASMDSFGTVDVDETRRFFDFLDANVGNVPFFALEAKMGNIDGMTPSARRLAADRLQRLPDRAIGIVGGSFAQRLLAKLIITGVAILDRRDRNVFAFFTDTDSARVWLREQIAKRSTTEQ